MSDIRAKLILDNRDFNRGLDDSERKTKRFSSSFVNVARVGKVVFASLAAVNGAITALSKKVSDAGAELRDLSRSLGLRRRTK